MSFRRMTRSMRKSNSLVQTRSHHIGDEVKAPRRFEKPMDQEGLLLTSWSHKCKVRNIKSVVMLTVSPSTYDNNSTH